MDIKFQTQMERWGLTEYEDYWLEFELNEDGTLKKAKFNWKKIDKELWECLFRMRWDLIKARRKERDQYKKKLKVVEEREMYKAEMIRCMEKNKRQREDYHNQKRTTTLYRKILEKLVMPCESE